MRIASTLISAAYGKIHLKFFSLFLLGQASCEEGYTPFIYGDQVKCGQLNVAVDSLDAFMQEKKRFSKWSNYKWSINGVKYTWDTFDTLPYDDKIYKIPIPTNEDENRSLMRFAKGQICINN